MCEETARFIGSWVDGIITAQGSPECLGRIISAFREVAGNEAPVYIQSHVSFAATEDEARANAFDRWRTNVLGAELAGDLRLVSQFEDAATHVRREDLDAAVRISAVLGQQREWIAQDLSLGVQGIFLHNVGRNQDQFIETFGTRVLPVFVGN